MCPKTTDEATTEMILGESWVIGGRLSEMRIHGDEIEIVGLELAKAEETS